MLGLGFHPPVGCGFLP